MKRPQYLYHGGSEKVDVLMPHQADDWRCEQGCHFGVYATSNRDVALAFVLGGVPDETGTCSRVIREQDRNPLRMVFVRGHPNFGGKGYLYKLSSEGFRHVGGDQWVCERPVTPVEITEIEVDDHLHLFRYAAEYERAEIERELEERMDRRAGGR